MYYHGLMVPVLILVYLLAIKALHLKVPALSREYF
jgi:hypothetical protein